MASSIHLSLLRDSLSYTDLQLPNNLQSIKPRKLCLTAKLQFNFPVSNLSKFCMKYWTTYSSHACSFAYVIFLISYLVFYCNKIGMILLTNLGGVLYNFTFFFQLAAGYFDCDWRITVNEIILDNTSARSQTDIASSFWWILHFELWFNGASLSKRLAFNLRLSF